jgi:N-acetylglucosaminyl-diphospho-decaprenol L-rhamnosyltransferase
LLPAKPIETSDFALELRTAVIVVTYGSSDDIGPCLESFMNDPAVSSIVVVDSGSPDAATTRAVVDQMVGVHFLAIEHNVGFGSACNRGAAVTTEANLVFLNPDTVVGERCVSKLVQHLRSCESSSDRCAVVGPLVRNPDGSRYPSARVFPSLLTAAGHAFLGPIWSGNPFSAAYLRSTASPEWVSGTAMAVRRDAFEAVGGFDEQYFMYVEDVDLCWRLTRAGWTVAMCEAAEVMHRIGGSSRRHRFAMIAHHHRSLWRFAKRSSTGIERVMLPAVAIALVVRSVALVILQAVHRRPPATLHR